jgi:hypothetical protein
MNAHEEARAALAAYDRASIHTVLTTVPALAFALRTLLDEPVPVDEREHETVAWIDYCLSLPMYQNVISEYGQGAVETLTSVRKWLTEGIHPSHVTMLTEQGFLPVAGFRRQGPITDDTDLTGLTYEQVGRLHGRTGGELSRRNAQARAAAGEDGSGW